MSVYAVRYMKCTIWYDTFC